MHVPVSTFSQFHDLAIQQLADNSPVNKTAGEDLKH